MTCVDCGVKGVRRTSQCQMCGGALCSECKGSHNICSECVDKENDYLDRLEEQSREQEEKEDRMD